MNQLILKRTIIFSFCLGVLVAIISLIPRFIALGYSVLAFFASVIVISFMKKNKRYLSYLTLEQSAVLGAVCGFVSTVAFFIVF